MLVNVSEESLLTHARKTYNGKTADAFARFFDNMEMPAPEGLEYTVTNHQGYLIFLNRYACLFNIIAKRNRFPDHPRILQPIKSFDGGKCDINLTPGIPSPLTDEDMERLSSALKKENVRWFDYASNYNGGNLPDVLDKDGKPYVVTIDNIGLATLTSAITPVKKLLLRAGLIAPSHQDQLYAPLRQLFNNAWPEKKKQPDQTKLQKAWQGCVEMKQQGKLVASWLKEDTDTYLYNYKNAYEGSTRYADRLAVQHAI